MSTTWMRHTAAIACLGLVGLATTAGAQDVERTRAVNFGIGGGFTVPMGDAADRNSTGWNVMGSIGIQPQFRAVGARFDLMYHSLEADIPTGALEDLAIISGTANAVLTVSNYPTTTFYVLGGVGLYNVDQGEVIEGETKFGLNGGAGVGFRVGGLQPFVEARLHSIFTDDENTNVIPIVFGLSF